MDKYHNVISKLDEETLESLSVGLPEFKEKNMNNIKNKFNSTVKDNKNSKIKKTIGKTLAIAASICILFAGSVNISPAFAEKLYNVPVIGTLAEWVSFEKIEVNDEHKEISIVIPELKELEDKDVQSEINKILKDRGMAVYDKALLEANEMETNAKEKGFITSMKKNVTQLFSVIRKDDSILSFNVITTEIAASGYETAKYYNVDLQSNKLILLKDLFKDGYDYITAINNELINLMEKANTANSGSYFIEEFKTIDDNTNFYFNKDNNLVIVFDEYEVAAGCMGMPELVIDKSIFNNNFIETDYMK